MKKENKTHDDEKYNSPSVTNKIIQRFEEYLNEYFC
jgi:hypothetical protein